MTRKARSLEVELNQEEVCHLEGDGSSRLSYGSEFDRELSREDEVRAAVTMS